MLCLLHKNTLRLLIVSAPMNRRDGTSLSLIKAYKKKKLSRQKYWKRKNYIRDILKILAERFSIPFSSTIKGQPFTGSYCFLPIIYETELPTYVEINNYIHIMFIMRSRNENENS